MHIKRSLIAISIATLLTACGDDDATFTPLVKPAGTESVIKAPFAEFKSPTDSHTETVVEPIVEPLVVNDLPCMITVRGELPAVIARFENACGITEYRNCEYVDYNTYQCSNQPPPVQVRIVEPEIVEEPVTGIEFEPVVDVPPPMRDPLPEPEVEPPTEPDPEPDPEPIVEDEVPEISMIEPIVEVPPKPVVKKQPVAKKPVQKPIQKPALRPVPRPTNDPSTYAYVDRHDLVMDYDDVGEGNVTTYGKLWAHVILNLGGDVWIAGMSDNVAAVLEYITVFYPDINTRNIKVVTTVNDHEATTATYALINKHSTLLEVADHDDIDVTIAANSVSAVSHTDGKLIVPDDLYPIGP